MNLSDINSGNPNNPQYKSWFNPICNSLTSSSVSTGIEYYINEVGLSGYRIDNGALTYNLEPSDIINGTIAVFGANPTIYNFPSAASLTAALGTPPTVFITLKFTFDFYAAGGQHATFNLPAGITTYIGTSSFASIQLDTPNHLLVTVVQTSPTTYIVFY